VTCAARRRLAIAALLGRYFSPQLTDNTLETRGSPIPQELSTLANALDRSSSFRFWDLRNPFGAQQHDAYERAKHQEKEDSCMGVA